MLGLGAAGAEVKKTMYTWTPGSIISIWGGMLEQRKSRSSGIVSDPMGEVAPPGDGERAQRIR